MRQNPKEAAGKTLVRRTGNTYEAYTLDEKAIIFKVRYLHGKRGRRCGGHKREGESALPGEICRMHRQKSAKAIVTHIDRAEGPNVKERDRSP